MKGNSQKWSKNVEFHTFRTRVSPKVMAVGGELEGWVAVAQEKFSFFVREIDVAMPLPSQTAAAL